MPHSSNRRTFRSQRKNRGAIPLWGTYMVWISIAVDKENENVYFADLAENKVSALANAKNQFHDLPIHCMELTGDLSLVHQCLEDWLMTNGVDDHKEVAVNIMHKIADDFEKQLGKFKLN